MKTNDIIFALMGADWSGVSIGNKALVKAACEALIESQSPDSNVEKNRELLLQRSVVGVKKYGVTTDKAQLTQKEWLQHALEEALDLANYLQAAISQIEAEENLLLKLKEQVIEVFDGEESARQSAEYFYALLEAAKRDR